MNKTPIEIAALVFGILLVMGLFLIYHPTMMNAAKGMGYRVVSLFGPRYVARRYSYGDGDRMHDGKVKTPAKKPSSGTEPSAPSKPSVVKHKGAGKKASPKRTPATKHTTKPATNNKPSNKKPAVKPSKPNKPANKPAPKPKAKPATKPNKRPSINPVTPVTPKKPVQPAKPKKPAIKPQPKKPAKPKIEYANEKVIFLNTDKKPISTQTVRGKKNSVMNVNAPAGDEYMNGKTTRPVTIKGDDLAVEVQSIKATDTIKFVDGNQTVKTTEMTGDRGNDVTGITAPTHYRITDNPKFTYDGSTHDVTVKENVVTNYAKVFDYDTGKQVGDTHTFKGLSGTKESVSIPNGYHLVEHTDNNFALTKANGSTVKIVIEKTRPPFGEIKARLQPMPGTPQMPGVTGVLTRGHNESPFTGLDQDEQGVQLPYRVAKVSSNVPKKYYGGELQRFTIYYKLD